MWQRVFLVAFMCLAIGFAPACSNESTEPADETLTPEALQGNLGLLGAQVISLPGGALNPSLPEATILGFVGPNLLRLGQPFSLRLTTNYRNPVGARNVILHVVDAKEGLIVDAAISPSGQSEQGAWKLDVQGKVGLDRELIGGPHMVELALLDPTGRVGAVVTWQFEVLDDEPIRCPEALDCSARSCGLDPLCGAICGSCGPAEACLAAGFCEPIHPGACPEAADCSQRSCGPDPVCGLACPPGCGEGYICGAAGTCLPQDDADTTTTGEDTQTQTTETSDDTTGCLPNCEDRQCGADPECGESCGQCEDDLECVQGRCEACIPNCDGLACGTDPVCGASCGVCDQGMVCDDGVCECKPDCQGKTCGLDPVCSTGDCGTCPGEKRCEDGSCIDETCVEDCGDRSCGPGPTCGHSCGTCAAKQVCDDGSCECVPDCTGLACGPDPVCGKSCGICGSGKTCEQGSCEDIPCEPQCGARECGPDPNCGKECGPCSGGLWCLTSQADCVQCLTDTHCPGRLNLCGQNNQCQLVACVDGSDCPDPANPTCGASHTCGPCTEVDGQCPGQAACDPISGRCLPIDSVFHVKEGDPACNDSQTGTSSAPLCSFSEAVTRVNASTKSGTTIRVSSVDGELDAGYTLQPTGSVAIIGVGKVVLAGRAPDWGAITAAGPLTIFDGVEITQSSRSCALSVAADSTIWVDHTVISGVGCGVEARASGAVVQLANSQIMGELLLRVAFGATVSLKNMQLMITRHDFPGIAISCAQASLRERRVGVVRGDYVTIANDVGAGAGHALACGHACDLDLTNSLIVGTTVPPFGPCTAPTITNSASDDPFLLSGSVTALGTVSLGELFVNPTLPTPDLHLRPVNVGKVSLLKNIALQKSGSPTTDIDGQARVMVGTRDYPGADKP